jgi:hypothetical protein
LWILGPRHNSRMPSWSWGILRSSILLSLLIWWVTHSLPSLRRMCIINSTVTWS